MHLSGVLEYNCQIVDLGVGLRTAVNWTEIPQDILLSISKKFTVYRDYVRFRAVCPQ
jgi:hypothetical protein